MKKRVRIYKPTNRFQEGGEQGMQFMPDQLISIYIAALGEPNGSVKTAENTLKQIGVDEETIAHISAVVEERIEDEQYLNEAVSTADEDDLADITADQAAIDAAAESERSALELAEEEARSDAMQQMYADYSEPDYGDDTEMAGELIQRYGGTPSKRNFLKNITKQFKKQLGGPSDSARVDSTDPENKRKDELKTFIGGVQEAADTKLMQDDAQAMYQMLTTPIGGEESYYQDEDMDYAQFGGMRRGQARRMNRRMNRMVRRMPIDFYGGLPGVYTYPNVMPGMMPGMMPMMPADGSVYGGPRLANIDVRRTGLFGRPKEYSITFDNDVITNPQVQQDIIKQEQKNKEQEVADEAKAAGEGTIDPGVEEKKESEAQKAIDAAEEAAVDINDIQVVSEKTSSKSTPRGKTDAWGRTPDNKWYGFDPKTKTWTKGTPDWAKKKPEEVKKKPVQEYQPIVEGTSYTVSDSNPRPLPNISKGKPSNKKVVEPTLRQYAEKFMPHWFTPTNMTNVVPRSTPREAINIADKFPFGGATDQDSGLYMFLYGGNDPGQSKLVNSPYFRDGGLYKFQGEGDSAVDSETNAKQPIIGMTPDDWRLSQGHSMGINPAANNVVWDGTQWVPGSKNSPQLPYNNPYMGYGMPTLSTRQRRMPYMTGTGQTYTGDLANAKVSKIDVKKTRAFGPYKGMPKKYTINYQVERDPLSKRLSFDESGMRLDGQAMSDIAPTRQGIFNRGERQQMFGKRPDTAFESRSRALSWLGSKLRPGYTDGESETGRMYTPQEERMLRKGYDPDTGLTQEELARKRERDAISNETFAFTPPEVSDTDWATEMPIPERVELDRLPLRRPSEFLTERTAPEPIFQDYRQPDFSKGYVAPEVMLEPDYGQVPASTVEPQSAFQYSLPEEFTQPEPQPMTEESYTAAMADEDELANQDFMMQQMAMQNPDFYNQDVYGWQPDLSGAETAELNLNPPPPQVVTAETVTPPSRRPVPSRRVETPRRAAPAPAQRVATSKPTVKQQQAPVTKKQQEQAQKPVETAKVKQVIKDAKKENIPASKTVNGAYDYDASVKGMTDRERRVFSEKVGAASNELKTLRQKAIGTENPQLWRDTYKNYKIPDTYLKTFNKLNPYQRLEYIKAIKNADFDLYNALLYKYGRYGGYMAYGGTLPQADIGEDTPINQDERFKPRNTSFDLGSTDLSNPFSYSGRNQFTGQESGVRMGTEGEYVNEGIIPEDQLTDFSQRKEYDDVSVDYKTRQKMSGAQRRRYLDMFNLGADRVLSFLERQPEPRTWLDMGSTASIDRGKDTTNLGFDFAAEYGQRRFGKQNKYGGGIYQLGGVTYKVGSETYMSPKQIADYIAKGGEIEFI